MAGTVQRVIAKLGRAPHCVARQAKIEWAQLASRGFRGYARLQAKSLMRRIDTRYPQALQVEPYGGCNIRCTMCFQGRMRLPGGDRLMPMERFCRVVDDVSPVTPVLYLYWRGEPLIHPEIVAMVRYAKSKDMYVFISTNATTLGARLADDLIDAELDFLLVGFDGTKKESYEAMRRGARFDEVRRNVQQLATIRTRRRARLPHICLQFIVSSVNVHELREMRRECIAVGADSYTEKTLDLYENFENEKIRKSLRPLFVEGALSKYEKARNFEYDRPSLDCVMAKRMVVRADGQLSLCCYDMDGRFPIGSVDKGNALELWKASFYTHLRRQGTARRTSLCTNCGAGIQQ